MNWCVRARILFVELLPVWLILAVSIVARLADITVRPLHSDEGVNYLFLTRILRDGFYQYDHGNYHGPLFHYLNFLSVSLIGWSEAGLRMVSIVCGIATTLLPLCLKGLLGWGSALFATALLAVSPGLIFYNRYMIHESLFVFSTILFLVSLLRWLIGKERSFLALGIVALALAKATKETVLITGAVTMIVILTLFGWRACITAIRSSALPMRLGIWGALLVLIPSYCWGVGIIDGLQEFALGFIQWTERGVRDTPHFKHWWHYGSILLESEPWLLLSLTACIPLSLGILPTCSLAARAIALWAIAHTFIYSAIPYKTPWLVLNMSVPLIIILAYIIVTFAGRLRAPLILGSVALSVALSIRFVVVIPYGSANPFSYLHTEVGMLRVAYAIQHLWKDQPGARVLVTSRSYWPLPYYLRNHARLVDFKPGALPEEEAEAYAVVLTPSWYEWNPPEWDRTIHRYREDRTWNMYVRQGARE